MTVAYACLLRYLPRLLYMIGLSCPETTVLMYLCIQSLIYGIDIELARTPVALLRVMLRLTDGRL